MDLKNKCYRILKEDPELIDQFTEFVIGAEFRVVQTKNSVGITAVQFRNGPFIDIKARMDSWFWCFYNMDNAEDRSSLEEIEELAQDPIESTKKRSQIKLDHFQGRAVDISYALSAFASQENCDSEEYDLMQKASEYIKWLESELEFSSRKF
ncbi:inhibitor of host Lon protease [Serratia phage 92A1]|nr:inhibitor of host Lon protease [Serratia phage 92A1]